MGAMMVDQILPLLRIQPDEVLIIMITLEYLSSDILGRV